MKLRDYQTNAVEACHKNERLAVQAPTGSGKSWIIAQYIKELREQNPSATVVLSTGFNNLVFDLHETLNDFGVKSRVVIGKAAAICGKSGATPDDPMVPYTDDKSIQPRAFGCNQCISSCCYKPRVMPGEVVVTNHSMLAVLQDQIDELPQKGVVIIDEAHTLYGYMSSHNESIVTVDHIKQIQLELVRKGQPAIKAKKLVDIALRNGVDKELIEASIKLFPGIIGEIDRAGALLRAPVNSLYMEANKDKSFRVRRFVAEKFLLRHKTLFFTATLNAFHLKYLALNEKNLLKVKVERPNSSTLHAFKIGKQAPNIPYVSALIEGKTDKRGLVLSPSFMDIEAHVSALSDSVSKYKTIASFKGPGILYGSRRFFQGVNIDDLNYIVITKLPFPVYNDEYVKWSEYLQKFMGISTWNITISQVESDLIQAAGRLWRKPGQEGEIHIALYGMPYDGILVRAVSEFFNLRVKKEY